MALAGAMTMPALAQAPEGRQHGEAAKEDAGIPIPPEANSITKHELTMGGQVIRYTATAGNLLIRGDQDKTKRSLFYVAYTPDCVAEDNRPGPLFFHGG